MNEKECARCGVTKSLADFYKRADCKMGRNSTCRACDIVRVRSWQDANPDKYTANLKAWQKANPEKMAATNRKTCLRRSYGVSVEQYDTMNTAQLGLCAICAGTNTNGKRLGVDHNHTTGQIRGLLCVPCNTAIGLLKECPTILDAAKDYLTHHNVTMRFLTPVVRY